MEIHVAGLVLDNDIGMGVAIVEELSGGFGDCVGPLHLDGGEVAKGMW